MAVYKYKALDEEGKSYSGKMQATSDQDLHEKLKSSGKFLVDYNVEGVKIRSKRLRSDHLADFSLNLSKLLRAGITLVRALDIIAEDESIADKERAIYRDLLKIVRQGRPLSDAMAEQGDTFPPLFINMMRSAENTGGMDSTAAQMADYYSKEYRLNQKVKSSMTYPKILVVMIIVVVAIIMGFVMPKFKDLFAQMDSLPIATTVLLGISNFVVKRWYILLFAAAVLFLLYKVIFAIPQVRLMKDKLELHLPVIGKLRKVIYTARFARTLSSLYSSGMPIISCLSIARTTIGNSYIDKQFDDVIAAISAGETLSGAIDKVDGFTKKLISTIGVGEETGSLDTMLISIADQMDYESEIATQKLVAMLEPTMIVVMALIVGFIMVAVIQPIYGSYQSISNTGM